MLTISRNQMKIFEQRALERYHQSLVSHLRAHFPGHAAYLGEHGSLRVIRHSCELAKRRGFETERDLCLYTDLTIMLGVGFDSDPQLEWAREILEDPILVDPGSRMNDLWDQAMRYMERVVGPGEAFPTLAYQAHRRQRLARTRNLTDSDEQGLIACFHQIWPEKARYVGTEALRTMISKSREFAARYGIRHDLDQVEFATLSFLFGHFFHEDPLYPWVGEALKDAQDRIRRLVDAFDEHLAGALD